MLNTSNDQRKLLPNFEQLFTTTAQAPGGVARLRELILTLAVQGKLVPQDTNDEPASELLKKIRAEKDRLIAEEKIKKDKPLLEVAEEEKSFELPLGWEWGRLGELTNYGSPSKAKEIKPETWVLDMEDVEKNTGRVLEKIRFKDRESLSEKNSFEKSDVIYGKLRPYLNKVLVADEDGVCTTEFVPISSFGFIDSNYLKLSLSNPIFMGYVESKLYGMKMPRLGTADARNAVVSIPPIAEQSRIVARVEELMRLCDALEEKGRLEHTQHQQLLQAMLDSLTQTTTAQELAHNWQRLAQHFDLLIDRPEAVDALEQTILQLAVRGLLVEPDANDEPASELLKRIRAEKDRLIAEGKIKKDKPLPVIAEDEKPFDLTEGWEWVRVGQVASRVQYGVTASADHTQAEPKFVRITDIQNDQVNWNTVPGMLGVNQELAEHYLNSGDLLVARTGGTIGKSFLVPSVPLKAVFASYLIRISPVSGINPGYLKIFVSSAHYWEQLYAKSMGTGQPNVNGTALSELTLPLPPFAEQSRIVARVTELRALCQQLREKLTQARNTQTQLAQAWVGQAAA